MRAFIPADKFLMGARILFLILLAFSFGQARAQWVAKAFGARKVQLQKPITAYESLLVLVDSECLERERVLSKHGIDPLKSLGLEVEHNSLAEDFHDLRYHAVAARALEADAEERLQAHPCVMGASENARVRTAANDPLASRQTSLASIGWSEAERLFHHPLWGIRSSVDVGVVDTGIQSSHPDLASRMWTGPNGERGWDFVNDDADPDDDSGHGTHVAGIIGAQTGNALGIEGLMGRHARLMPVKSQGADGGGNMADVVNAIRWAVDHGAEILNLSLTSTMQNPALEDAIQYALALNRVAVVASGNEGQEITSANFIAPVGYAKDYMGLLGVGSIDALTNLKSTFSNFSPTYVEYAAPGSSSIDGIYSTFRGASYRGLDGTSMAAPHVTAASALVMAFLKTNGVAYTPEQIELLVQNSMFKDSNLSSAFVSGRRLQMERLGRILLNSTFVDSTGGFDEP